MLSHENRLFLHPRLHVRGIPFPFKGFSPTPLRLCRTPIAVNIRDFHPYFRFTARHGDSR